VPNVAVLNFLVSYVLPVIFVHIFNMVNFVIVCNCVLLLLLMMMMMMMV